MHPVTIIQSWLESEKNLGSTNPDRMVLATASAGGLPGARVVAIREISESGVLFFTQRDTRKVSDLKENKQVSAVIWLPQQQRQIVLDGVADALSADENHHYWQTMPQERQLRFTAYAPTSGQVIASPQVLDDKLQELSRLYGHEVLPMSAYYCGFRIVPAVITFYTLGGQHFSEVTRYTRQAHEWSQATLSP